MPKFREMNYTSAYEVYSHPTLISYSIKCFPQYLEKRFDRSVRICVSLTLCIFMVKTEE